MQAITPCLWFKMDAEEAVSFYLETFSNSRVLATSRYGEGAQVPAGTVLTIDFELDGLRMQALNGGPEFPFSEAVSFTKLVDGQDEVDRLWAAISRTVASKASAAGRRTGSACRGRSFRSGSSSSCPTPMA
jgi:predicted 3-demethylubiquinone-9 3-methyltransferase (glyoxalase superfamily)